MDKPKGSVLVVGGGIAGVQAALDLADSGFFVHLVEKESAIGGAMSQLDKTYPTNDCSVCIFSPKLVECGRHLNINLVTLASVEDVTGKAGNFTVKIRQAPRFVDPDRCIACGSCSEKCPKKVPNQFDLGLSKRKAIYLKYPQAVPLKYTIDSDACIYLKRPGRCGACVKVCPTDAINFEDREKSFEINVGSIILATGFRPFDPAVLDFTGYGKLPGVVTSMEFERILSPSGPTHGHLKRPNGKDEPKRIAWLQCVGSRDINRACHGYCSTVCCMYAIKQAVIAREHASWDLDTHVFYMDVRTMNKGFEAYYSRARKEGVNFHRSRVHSVLPQPPDQGDGLILRYSGEDGELKEQVFDMVVLSVGVETSPEILELAGRLGVRLDHDRFLEASPLSPVSTSRPGIYACGAALEPKAIPLSVVDASAAVLESELLIHEARWSETRKKEFPPERNIYSEPPRIGVFVCSCGINIGAVVDVERVCRYAQSLPGVVFAQTNLFSCSQDAIERIAETIREKGLNRVVVASCSPRTHEPLFQETLREAGINKYLFEMANIRDQDSWVHRDDPEAATRKAMDLVRMAVAKVRRHIPLPYESIPVTKAALVVGGGVAGMTAALALADQGFPVHLVEKGPQLGGNARTLQKTWRGDDVQPFLHDLVERTSGHSGITLHLGALVQEVSGSVGKFSTTLSSGTSVEHGVAIVATGAASFIPRSKRDEKWRYLHGQHKNSVTLLELDRRFMDDPDALSHLKQVVFIHCVGSRAEDRLYCSRMCCSRAIRQALQLKKLNPGMEIFMLYRDIMTYGKREEIYLEARRKGIIFIRYDLDSLPRASLDAHGKIQVDVRDHILQEQIRLHPDLLVLATAAVPREDSGELSQLFKCAVSADGFLLEAHMKLRPVDFATDGVFLAGLCHYPKPIEETIAQAKAAAARAGLILARDYVPAESITASVDQTRCVGCGVCQEVCPYFAVKLDEKNRKAVVDKAVCKGCGVCVASCRSDAITLLNLGNQELMSQIEALMEDDPEPFTVQELS